MNSNSDSEKPKTPFGIPKQEYETFKKVFSKSVYTKEDEPRRIRSALLTADVMGRQIYDPEFRKNAEMKLRESSNNFLLFSISDEAPPIEGYIVRSADLVSPKKN